MPLYTSTDLLNMGPLGVEAEHYWTSGDGAQTYWLGRQTGANSRSVVNRMPGFRSAGEITDARTPRSGRLGEVPHPLHPIGKTYTVEGEIRAVTMKDLRLEEIAMQAAFSERSLEGTLAHRATVALGDQTYWWTSTSRVMSLQLDDDPAALTNPGLAFPYRIAFLLGLRMSDPRFKWTNQLTATDPASLSVTVAGSAPADPVVTILTGAGTNAILNTTLGRKLTLLGQPGAEHVVFDFGARSITSIERPTHDYLLDMDDANSDWWDPDTVGLVAGAANAVSQTGGTSITVAYNPRSW